MIFEDYSPRIQEFIKNIGLFVFLRFNFQNLTEEEIIHKCSTNSVEDIIQNYEEKLALLKKNNDDSLTELRNINSETLAHKQSIVEELNNRIHSSKELESENISHALEQNNKFNELEKQNLLNKISSLENEQSIKNLIEERFLDKKEFNNPTEQGDYAEKILDEIVNSGLPFDRKATIEDTSGYGGSGDRIINFHNGFRLMIEVKNKDPIKKTDIDDFVTHYSDDFKSEKVDMALFLSYRTTQCPQRCKAIIPTYFEDNKVVYFGLDNLLDKEQKREKIKNCLEEIYEIFQRNKTQSKISQENQGKEMCIYNITLKELKDNLTLTDKSIKDSTLNIDVLKQRRLNIVKQTNSVFSLIHSQNINVDKSLLDEKLYRKGIIERIQTWFENAEDIKKKDWKKNMKKEVVNEWSEYDMNILNRIKRSEFTS
jgi:hypothetical protein